MFRQLLFALVLAAVFLPSAVLAEEIASYTIQTAPGSQFVITNNGGSSETISMQTVLGSVTTPGAQIQFQFAAGIPTAFGTSTRDATMYLDLETTGPPKFLDPDTREVFAGTFFIEDNLTNTDLLSGSIAAGRLDATPGDTGIAFSFNAPPVGNALFRSDYLSFADAITAAVSFNMTDVSPSLSIGTGGYFANATAEGGGSFSANPPPVMAPEPTTLLLGGGALLGMGYLLRKRRGRQVL